MHKMRYNIYSTNANKYEFVAFDQINKLYKTTSNRNDLNTHGILSANNNNKQQNSNSNRIFNKFLSPLMRFKGNNNNDPATAGTSNPTDSATRQQQTATSSKLLAFFQRRTNRSNSQLFSNNSFFNARRKSNQPANDDLDTKTQLLINYARIDALTSSASVRLHKKQATNNIEMNCPSSPTYVKSQNNKLGVNAGEDALQHSINTIEQETGLISSQQQHQQQENKNGSENLLHDASKRLSPQKLQSTIVNMRFLNRRRHSWPKAKLDNLQYNNYNRKMRYFLHEQQRLQVKQREETTVEEQHDYSLDDEEKEYNEINLSPTVKITSSDEQYTTPKSSQFDYISAESGEKKPNNRTSIIVTSDEDEQDRFYPVVFILLEIFLFI